MTGLILGRNSAHDLAKTLSGHRAQDLASYGHLVVDALGLGGNPMGRDDEDKGEVLLRRTVPEGMVLAIHTEYIHGGRRVLRGQRVDGRAGVFF